MSGRRQRGRTQLQAETGASLRVNPGSHLSPIGTRIRTVGGSGKQPICIESPVASEDGNRLFDAVRYTGKQFMLAKPGEAPRTGPMYGVRRVLYRLSAVIDAVKNHRWVVIVEGEKDADTLTALGIDATTNPMGASTGKWNDDYSKPLTGANVAIIGDNDDTGRKHAARVARSIAPYAAKVVIVDLSEHWPDIPEGGDVTDWLHGPGDKATLLELIEAAEPAELEEPATEWDTPSLLDAMAGEYEAPTRGVLHRSDGEGLIYPGQIHAVAAEPEALKTVMAYLALGASSETPVVLIDYEMGPIQAAERLQLLCIDIDDS